jgi:hypothetical protein
MKTLKELIEETKCRKGKACGTNKRGAWWLAVDTAEYDGEAGILIKAGGGDGVGQSAPTYRVYLQLRHYRNGDVGAVIQRASWHGNTGDNYNYTTLKHCGGNDAPIIGILAARTVEDAVVALKAADFEDACYSDTCYDELRDGLIGIGMPEAEQGPDEELI